MILEPIVQLAASPSFVDDRTLYSVSLDEGVSRSTNGGESWEPAGTIRTPFAAPRPVRG